MGSSPTPPPHDPPALPKEPEALAAAMQDNKAQLAGGRQCRAMAEIVVRAVMDLLQDASVDGQVSMEQVRRVGTAILASTGPLSAYYAKSANRCEAQFDLASLERKRTDFLGRLITHPLGALLDDPASGVERKNLPQFFAAIRMILCDETHAELKARCAVIAEEYRDETGIIPWDAFYQDPDAMKVLEQVLVTLARSFRRFEPRKDWFLIVMNSNPSTISLGSSVFVARKPEDKVLRGFTEIHMARLFEHLFATMRPEAMTEDQAETFEGRWGSSPQKLFGPLFVEITSLGANARG